MCSARCSATARRLSRATKSRCSGSCSTVCRAILDDLTPPRLHLTTRRLEVVAVVDDPCGARALLVDRQLRVEPLARLALGEVVTGGQAGHLRLWPCVDEQNPVHSALEAA